MWNPCDLPPTLLQEFSDLNRKLGKMLKAKVTVWDGGDMTVKRDLAIT